jgi:hypothetical protein
MDTMINQGRTVVLGVGEDFHLVTGKDHIIYAGMPNEEVYSIVQKKASGYQGYAWNLFFPKKRRDITIDGIKLDVERATPEDIQFRVT